MYADMWLEPIVAPDLEFYYIQKNIDQAEEIKPAVGISGRPEFGFQVYGIEALNYFDPFVGTLYDYAEASRLNLVLHRWK